MPSSLTIPFQGADPSAESTGTWLNLERVPLPSSDVNLVDLAQMLARSMAGISARTYKPENCPVTLRGGILTVPVDFWVWPSAIDQAYTLSPAIGVVDQGMLVEDPREFDLVVPMTDSVSLPFLTVGAGAWWQTPCYNAFGEVVPSVGFEIEGNQVKLDEKVFGVLRVGCRALGYRHTCTMQFDKSDAVRISDVKNVLTAAWVDEDGKTQTEQEELLLPACAEALLELCPDDTLALEPAGTILGPDELVPVAYYSTCHGFLLLLRYE